VKPAFARPAGHSIRAIPVLPLGDGRRSIKVYLLHLRYRKGAWAAIQRKTRLWLTSTECLIRIVSATAPKAFRDSAARGNILTLRKRLFTCLLLISPAAGAQYSVTLHFPDHSIQVCVSTGYVVDFVSLDVNVTSCNLDTIFADSMGG